MEPINCSQHTSVHFVLQWLDFPLTAA